MKLADRYRLDVLLGRGGMGEVWGARDERLDRPVAVKLCAPGPAAAVPPPPLPSPAAGGAPRAVPHPAAARFDAEARIAARLSDPHVVSVYDAGVFGERHYLVMELMEGRSLAQTLAAEGPLAPDRAVAVAAQTAAGLAAAHRHGIVHRDIKPSNLLQGPDGTVKIADFGIARCPTDDAAETLTITGTSLYLAPESALGRTTGPPADVYALGCTLYELLTGHPPFEGGHPLAVLCQHVEKVPAPPGSLRPGLPGALAAYVLRMLAKSPDVRPTAAEAAEYFDGGQWRRGTVELPPVPAEFPPPRTAEPAGPVRRRVPALAAAAGAVLTVTALAVLPIAHAGHAGTGPGVAQSPVAGAPSPSSAVPAAGARHPARTAAPTTALPGPTAADRSVRPAGHAAPAGEGNGRAHRPAGHGRHRGPGSR